MPTLLLFSGALAQFPGELHDDDSNIHYYLYLLSARIPNTRDGGIRTCESSSYEDNIHERESGLRKGKNAHEEENTTSGRLRRTVNKASVVKAKGKPYIH